MAFPYAGTAGIASVVYERCSYLVGKYFRDPVSAPYNYRLLGKEVQRLKRTLEILCDYKTGGVQEGYISSSSRVNLDEAYQAAQKSIEELDDFLKRYNVIENADTKWWKDFSEKLRFAGEGKRMEILKVRFFSHVQELEVLRSDMRQ